MAFSISRPLYPSPTHYMLAGTSTVPTGQMLAVTSTATSTFALFNSLTECVVMDIKGGNVYCTFDGTTPSSSLGHILYVGASFTWSKAAAQQAKFVATTTSTTQIYASEFTT